MKPGARNLITDVAGLKVGNAGDARAKTGVTVITAKAPFVAGVAVMGGAPGTRETDLLAPDKLVQEVDAVVLSGGSAFGLDAASGVMNALAADGRGFRVREFAIPIVPAAIMIDLTNGGDKSWAEPPYRRLGAAAYRAADEGFEIGTAGAGVGATSMGLKGGLGSASLTLGSGATVGAIVVANPVGSVVAPGGRRFWAGSWEVGEEFGGLGPPAGPVDLAATFDSKPAAARRGGATVIAAVATDVALTQAEATRMAWAAHDGIARAVSPSHTPYDGDTIFAISTAARPPSGDPLEVIDLGHGAAICLARAIARAVYEATPAPGDPFPCWRDL